MNSFLDVRDAINDLDLPECPAWSTAEDQSTLLLDAGSYMDDDPEWLDHYASHALHLSAETSTPLTYG